MLRLARHLKKKNLNKSHACKDCGYKIEKGGENSLFSAKICSLDFVVILMLLKRHFDFDEIHVALLMWGCFVSMDRGGLYLAATTKIISV